MDSPEIIHDRLKKRLRHLVHAEREYAVLKLQRNLKNIQIPPGFPEGTQTIFEAFMESILETTNTSLMIYADGILTAVAEELSYSARPK